MALPGQSPSFNGPSSPPRSFSGYPDPQGPPHTYGGAPRPMLPPSPQHFHPRYPPASQQAPSPAPNANNGAPLPHKRPGSSMSISSMLDAEPARPVAAGEQFSRNSSRTPSRPPSVSGPNAPLSAAMSPPQYPAKLHANEYTYKPRSKTPDRATGPFGGTRPQRSSSGTMTQRPSPFYEAQQRPQAQQPVRFPDQMATPPFGLASGRKDELDDRARRTSISGILQRPESEPQSNATSTHFSGPNPPARPESHPPVLGGIDRSAQPMTFQDPPRSNGFTGSYDTRPPNLPAPSRIPLNGSQPQPQPSAADRPFPQSVSPELRRPHLNGDGRGVAGFLSQQAEAQNMMRQDSVQSQSDLSILGERSRMRAFSPFAGSVASQGMLDDVGRKGSDEISQHRAILALNNESKRGRYSPVPQAVQGAQAQTPVPDAGIKTEHGRVFAGIGSGLPTTSAGVTPTPQPLPASPFKQNDTRLSEENLLKMSRSTSGVSKRARKQVDEDPRAESETGDPKKPPRGKRSKYAHSYKLDLEEAASQRKSGQLLSTQAPRRTGTPTSHPLHHRASSPAALRPRKTIRISSVIALARHNPRKHLGSFTYCPSVTRSSVLHPSHPKFDVSIRPNLPPLFDNPDHVNCTYTIRVPRLWLASRERALVASERHLWGSGIYTDDSDPLAAAMHAGFVQAAYPEGTDETLLSKVIQEQNPKIEGGFAPSKPVPVEAGKDLHLTLLVLPSLERYAESTRFGVRSRGWPGPDDGAADSPTQVAPLPTRTPHDGVSFAVLKAEFVDEGAEVRRMGRTGAERRERLRRELLERKRGEELERQKIREAALRLKAKRERERERSRKRDGGQAAAAGGAGSAPAATTASLDVQQRQQRRRQQQQQQLGDKTPELDVGQSPGDWIRQTAIAAA